MAITFDQSVSDNNSFSAAGGTLTKSLTIGADAAILLTAFYGNNSAVPDSVTWNGDAMTQVPGSPLLDGGNRVWMYYIVSPDIGTFNCVIDAGAGCNVQQASYASYNGVDTLIPFDANASGTAAASGTSTAQSITTATANAWIVGYHQHSADEASSAGASTTQRSSSNGATLGASNAWYDRAVPVAGAETLNVSWATSATNAAFACALKPAAGSAKNNGISLGFGVGLTHRQY